MRIYEFRFGLPAVLYSDHPQPQLAADLISYGYYIDNGSSYPATHIYAYAGADLVAFAAGRLFGAPWAESWDVFRTEIRDSGVSFAIAHAYTAIVGALLAVAVYRLARVRLPRGPALLAAAIAAFCPAHVIYSHQARIHVPGIVALCFGAAPALRMLDAQWGRRGAHPRTAARAMQAGIGAGIAASIFQLGVIWSAALAVLSICIIRPPMLAVRTLARAAGAALLAAAVLFAASHLPGVHCVDRGGAVADSALTLGIPSVTLGMHFFDRFPGFVVNWVMVEPVRAAVAVAFLIAAVVHRPWRRELLLYGAYPAIVFVALGTNFSENRYSLSVIPFLASWCALLAASIPVAPVRRLVAVLLVASPLADSLRYDWLLDRRDTRHHVDAALDALDLEEESIVLEAGLATRAWAGAKSVQLFPPKGDYWLWSRRDHPETPMQTLLRMRPNVYVTSRRPKRPLGPMELQNAGLMLVGFVPGAPETSGCLPESLDWLSTQLWQTTRPGPTVEIWVRTPVSYRRVRALASVAALEVDPR